MVKRDFGGFDATWLVEDRLTLEGSDGKLGMEGVESKLEIEN